MLDAVGQLSAAQLAIYLSIIFFPIFIAIKHGRPGFSGWGFLFLFCTLRILGSALQISNEKSGTTSTSTQIINGIGLSPLILTFSGILQESNHYLRTKPLNQPAIPYIIMHLVVGAGLALVIVGYQPSQAHKSGPALQKVGYIIFLLAYLAIAGLIALSWRHHQQGQSNVDAKRLLMGLTFGLPLLLVRIIYSMVSSFDSDDKAFTGSIACRVVLSALMEFIIVITFVVLGIWTKNIKEHVQYGIAHEVEGSEGDLNDLEENSGRLETPRSLRK